MTKNPTIAIILLAAGSAKRMQKNKLLLNFGGKTLLDNALKAAQNSIAGNIFLVLGANQKDNLEVSKMYEIERVINKDWKKGIGTSIKSGLKKALQKSPDLSAVIISVCDQPYLTSKIFDGLINTYIGESKKIIASSYSDSTGVPVLYDKSFFTDLLNIPDEHGAKKYIIETADENIIAIFPFPNGEIDIDTIEDIERLPRS